MAYKNKPIESFSGVPPQKKPEGARVTALTAVYEVDLRRKTWSGYTIVNWVEK